MPLILWLLWLWLILLVGLWIVCLVRIPAGERKGLLPAGLAVFLLAALLFGGDRLLAGAGLTWRMGPRYLLCVLLWVCGLGVGILTVGSAGKLLPGTKGRPVQVLAGLCLAAVLCVGTVFGGMWAAFSAPGETVGIYHGQTVVQGKWVWLDVTYELYEYHGALVRGKDPILAAYEPILEDAS